MSNYMLHFALLLHVCSLPQALSLLLRMSQKVGSRRLHWLTVCLNITTLALVSKVTTYFSREREREREERCCETESCKPGGAHSAESGSSAGLAPSEASAFRIPTPKVWTRGSCLLERTAVALRVTPRLESLEPLESLESPESGTPRSFNLPAKPHPSIRRPSTLFVDVA